MEKSVPDQEVERRSMISGKIEVWFLIGMLPIGGAERTLVDLANNINKDRFSVTVWTIMDVGELRKDLGEDVQYRSLNARAKWDLRAPVKFLNAARTESPDVINSFLFFDNQVARATGQAVSEISIITGVRSVPNDRPKHRSLLDKKTQSWSDLIVSNSEAGAEYAIRRGASPDKVRVIRNGRDIDLFTNGRATEALYTSLGLNRDHTIVGTVGRLVERKGHYDLLRAWAEITDAYPDARLLIVGDGPERAGLKKKARELDCPNSIVFAGQRNDVPDLLGLMDVFVFPSHYEGLPGALIEAMIAGLPIVATPVDGNAELIEDGVTGRFVPPHDDEAIADRLTELLDDTDLQENLGTAASEYARGEFAIESMVAEFESLYQELRENN